MNQEAAIGPEMHNSLYRAIFAHPDMAFFMIHVSPEGEIRLEDGNQALAQWLDRPLEEMLGRTVAEFLPRAAADSVESNVRVAIAKRAVHLYDRQYALPAGEMSWTTTLAPLVEDDRPVTHVLGMVTNISFRKKPAGDEAHRQALIDHLGLTCPNMIYIFDVAERRNRVVAGQVEKMLGYSREALDRMGNRLMSNLLHPGDFEMTEAHFARLSDAPEGLALTNEYRMRHRDGNYRRLVSRDMVISRDSAGKAKLILGVATDVGDALRVEEEVRDLGARMLTLRDAERLRLAEALQEVTGQHLAAAGLALLRLQMMTEDGGAPIGEVLHDVRESLDGVKREIRVLTYLLRPPLFEGQGLGAALRIFAEGFAERAGIKVDVEIAPDAENLPVLTWAPLFRAVQEAFSNIHRHASAKRATLSADVQADEIVVTVCDDGAGFDILSLDGGGGERNGFVGMRTRMAQIGGSFEIKSWKQGTTIVAKAPLERCPA
jgi:PAS domain S-box-containing protein